MAQFDVYENLNELTRKDIPFLLDLQADLLNDLATRIVAPLKRASAIHKPIAHLHPAFHLLGKTLYLSAPELAGVPTSRLGKRVGSLKAHRPTIIATLDFLFTGF